MSSAKITENEKLMLINGLGTMITAGIPLLETVDSLLKDSSGNLKKILLCLREDLNQGKTISQSFAKFPQSFGPVDLNLIKASEASGNLDTILKDLTLIIKKEIEFNSKVKAALTYPILVMVIFSGVLLMILTFVIPRIAQVFSRLQVEMPLPTQILISISNLIINYTVFVVAALGLLLLAALLFYRNNKKLFKRIIFSLPILSGLMKEIDLTRFSRSLALLLSSGIPITAALELSGNVVTSGSISNSIFYAKNLVSSGKSLSEGLKSSRGKIPDIILRITEAGEKTGTLDKSMQEISDYFDNRVTDKIKTLTTLLEPVLLVIVGLLVGGIMLSVIAPIYNLIGQISTR